ncbi:MAG: cell division protein FtsA [Treponema sp.]|nr:cell division protein FtsA [Treponema sp.]
MVVGLDIGTTFIKTVIGELDEADNISIIGFAKKPSQGLRNGVIVNIDAAVAAINATVDAAEQMAGVNVDSVFTAIGGSQVESLNSEGDTVVDTSGRNRTLEIKDEAKKRAIDASTAISTPMDKEMLHCIPQEYFVDDMPGVKDPINMMGKRLKVKVHIILANKTACNNLEQCISRAGYSCQGFWLWPKTLVAALATIHEDEMELGSILIDLGGGTTDVMVVNKGAPVFMASIPVGGNLVTNDIAVVKGIPISAAEKIKVEHGCCWINGNELGEEVIIPGVGGRPPEETTQYELCEIIQPRVDEIFSMVKAEIVHHANLTQLNGSIVLTGGGAKMTGIVELAQSVWGTTSVRIGEVSDLGGLDKGYREPDFATAVGLVDSNKAGQAPAKQKKKNAQVSEKGENLFKKMWKNFF